MKKQSRLMRAATSIFNIRLWSGYDHIREQSEDLSRCAKGMFTPSQRTRTEDLAEVMQRFHMSEADIQRKKHELYRLSWVMILLSVPILVYTISLLLGGHIHAALLGIVVSSIPLVLAFRYHFWYFQLKVGRLGVGLYEWFYRGLLGVK